VCSAIGSHDPYTWSLIPYAGGDLSDCCRVPWCSWQITPATASTDHMSLLVSVAVHVVEATSVLPKDLTASVEPPRLIV
jgi:hypothetical protein